MWLGLALLHIVFAREHNAIVAAAARGLPALGRRPPLRQGAADQLGADGQDPHRRVDAGDHRPPDDREGDPRHLVRAARPRRAAALRALRRARDPVRDPGLAHRPPRRAVLAHRGVRDRLPAAPADARRLRVRRRARYTLRELVVQPGKLAPAARAPARGRRRGRRLARARHPAARARSSCTTTRARCSTWPRIGGLAADRPRGGGHPALARDRRRALQRVPAAAAAAARGLLRGAGRRQRRARARDP